METLKKIVSNQYFPAAAVLAAVVLFWLVGLLGGLSLLHNNQPPLTTLTWMLFVYTAAVLSPLAGILAATDLLRRWRRNRAAEAAYTGYSVDSQAGEGQVAVEPAGGAQAMDAPEEPAVPHTTTPAAKASQPKKTSKQAGRKQAA
jgi:hypothetical protein